MVFEILLKSIFLTGRLMKLLGINKATGREFFIIDSNNVVIIS